jgi:hypothetical protein
MAAHPSAATPSNAESKTEESSDSGHARDASDGPSPELSNAGGEELVELDKTTKILLVSSVLLSMFLVALDRTIISTVRTNAITLVRHDRSMLIMH